MVISHYFLFCKTYITVSIFQVRIMKEKKQKEKEREEKKSTRKKAEVEARNEKSSIWVFMHQLSLMHLQSDVYM